MTEKKRTPKNIFRQGPISPDSIATSIANHSSKTGIGGHSIFLGQVRADEKEIGQVTAIEYSAYEEMALEQAFEIREEIFSKYPLTCMHIYHSLGTVKAGEICLFVFTSSKHRKAAMDACEELVERIKKELPIWGKEITDKQKSTWKENN
ncbi:molybdenum cofactor biosynthesis protein MoaE [Litoribacter populi]|uniref:molybdenum cofactor biosynthesis protein MoaE n=1 Tax=Litoribacter populi TaxID=2598460 RepID=UPI00117EEA5F|nr:molybdenum cofactor biosynthesis protein MoaE [Litoribacter populi]